jgi:uncharacterized membrane protein
VTENFPRSQRASAEGLEAGMQKVSLVVALVGIGLMASGFIKMLFDAAGFDIPGAAALPLGRLITLATSSLGLILTSAGIIVLGLLPAIRVILALGLYLHRRDRFSALIALIVFLELLVSIHLST